MKFLNIEKVTKLPPNNKVCWMCKKNAKYKLVDNAVLYCSVWCRLKHIKNNLDSKLFLAISIYAVLACIFFFNILFGGKSYTSLDSNATKSLVTPLAAYHKETGNMPLWSPYIFCGMPTAGSMMYNGQVYMPGVPFVPFSKILPNLFFILHNIFAGLGVYLFLSRRKIGFHSALFGGIAFMFTPYLIAMFAVGHGSQMMTAAYLPWMLWGVDRLAEKISLRNIALSGLIFGFALQRGHVQIFYYGALLCGLYDIFQAVANRNVKHFLVFIPILLIAIALAAMVYLPVSEYAPYSIRGAGSAISGDAGVGFKYATDWKMSAKEFLTFLVPSILGFGGETYHGSMAFTDFPNYAGILVLLLAFAGAFYSIRYKNSNRLLAIFLASSILLLVFLSFGGSFYRIFYNYFPYWNRFRVPSMLLILVNMNLAILAGLGLEQLTKIKIEERYLWASLAVLALGLLVLFVARDAMIGKFSLTVAQFDMLHMDAVLGVIFLIAGGVLLLLLQYNKTYFALVASFICVITLLDLWQVDRRIGKMERVNEERIKNPIVDFFKKDSSLFRVHLSGAIFSETVLAADGIESTGGYHPAKPRLYQDLLDAAEGKDARDLISMLNVKYQVVQLQDGKINVYLNPEYLPRAYFVMEYEVEDDPKKRLEKMINGFDFKNKVMLTEVPECPSPPSFEVGKAILLKKDHGLDYVKINVSNQTEQILVLTDGYYPAGWQAYVDGYPVKTYQANHAFRAVCVPGGAKTVEFRYVSNAYRNGWIISVATLVICLAGIIISRSGEIGKRAGLRSQ